MTYTFKGTLHGALCRNCVEPLAGLTLELYRVARIDPRTTALAVAAAKDTFGPVDDDSAAAKAGRLLGRATIGDDGGFAIVIDDKTYAGEPFEIDLWCPTVPRLKPGPKPPRPLRFTITVHQPAWRDVQGQATAAWSYTIPFRAWCGVRGRFGAWTICGQVSVCDSQQPLGGVRVKAFDVDWLQDDALGEAISDATGHFRIDYLAADFQQTIFSPSINLEWAGGPDLYFKVETLGGAPLLAEPPSRGRASDRENAGPCFCVDLCVKEAPPASNEPLAAFDALGGLAFATDVASSIGGNGKTLADQRAFTGTVRCNGVLPKTLSGQPLEYRFEWRATDTVGSPSGPWQPVQTTQFAATWIGRTERFAPAFPGDPNPVKTSWIVADPANPAAGPNNAAIVDGWIRVPQGGNVFGPDGFFVANGNMANVVSSALLGSPGIDVLATIAGASAGPVFAANRHLGLRLRVRQVGVPASETDGGLCAHIAVENTRYANVAKGGSWAPSRVSGQWAVVSVDVLQLRSNGCAGVQAGLDVVVTCAHPNLGAVGVSMQGPGGPYGFAPPATGATEAVGAATPVGGWTVAGLADCAYIIDLSAQILLTNGDAVPDPVHDRIGFCKK
jgi:hypothetical protein